MKDQPPPQDDDLASAWAAVVAADRAAAMTRTDADVDRAMRARERWQELKEAAQLEEH
jgi:hypothetical protein